MDERELRARISNLATAAIPEASALPPSVRRRAARGRARTALLTTGTLACVFFGGFYALDLTTNLVGPAPFAGGPGQEVQDPPDRAYGGGFGLNGELVDGRMCAIFEFEYFDGEDHRANAQVCDPDPTAILSLDTRFIDIGDAMEPSGLVVLGAGVAPEVARVRLELPDDSLPLQNLPIMEDTGETRRVAGHAIGREHFIDKQGRFDAVLRAFDAEGELLAEIRVCDPLEKAPCGPK